MSLTIVLSGPKTAESQARTALASAGFCVHGRARDYGLPDHAHGHKRQTVAFISCEGDDLDRAVKVAKTLGYALRLHHGTVPEPEPSPMETIAATLAEMQREIAALKAKVG